MDNKGVNIILLICITIISIILGYGYSYFKNNNENFTDITTLPQTTISNQTFSRTSLLSDFQNTLNRFKFLDIPITITNSGKSCNNWGDFQNDKYKDRNNRCIKMEGRNINQCIVNGDILSCNDFFKDGKLDDLNNIDISQIYDDTISNIDNKITNIKPDIDTHKTQLEKLINNLIDRKNIENQQLYFIEYNGSNMDSKNSQFNKTNKEYEKKENDFNINSVNFSNILQKNKDDENTKNLNYKILKYTIYILIILIILNILFSEL